MSALKHRYSEVWSTLSARRRVEFEVPVAGVETTPTLRYSSPWPWVLAVTVSLFMWAGVAWLVWFFV
jgi:hypothetical protein